MSKPRNSTIEVQGTDITILSKDLGDYISLTDMVRNFEGGSALIEQWLKNKDTVLFLGVWERIHNPDFNSLEFEGIRNEAGRNSFFLSAKAWIERTRAKGLAASEADVLNVALFGQTARQWRDANPKLDGNMRDHATIEQLLVLANIEGMNAEFIHMALPQGDRLKRLNQIAIRQMQTLTASTALRQLEPPA